MNFLKHLVGFSLLLAVVGCSTSSSTQETPIPPVEETPTPAASVFHLFVNGTLKEGSGIKLATKTENLILIKTYYGNISFDKNGHFGYYNLDLKTNTVTQTSLFYSYFNYSSNFFNFNFIQLDEVNKRVKGTFSGYVYANTSNLNSEQKFINGDFDVRYEDVVPTVVGVKNQAKINGNPWSRTNKHIVRNSNTNYYITQHDVSDNEYEIKVNYDWASIALGNYSYSATAVTNCVQLAKYDVATSALVNYNCVGTLVITQKEGNIISGTYSFTATNPSNPSDVIQVTEGSFKQVIYNL